MLKQIVFSVIICLIAVYAFYNYHSLSTFLNSYLKGQTKAKVSEPLFTTDEIKLYNGVDKKELYLVILGHVFDVTKGAQHYGPGEGYNIFIGRDNTQGFITGNFELEAVSDKVIGFSQQELRALNSWLQFYQKEYPYVGKLIGRYFDENRELTQYGKETARLIAQAEQALINEDIEKQKFPPCNVEWEASKGTRFWCTKRSGGIERDWVGVPRKLFEAGSTSYRCACINEDNMLLGNIKLFDGCDLNSESCYVDT